MARAAINVRSLAKFRGFYDEGLALFKEIVGVGHMIWECESLTEFRIFLNF